jgi:tetratricopeptide (TPR) repeat protein
VPEDAVDEELTRASKHDGGAKEVKLPSHVAPREQEATALMPKKRAPSVMVIAGTAAVLTALALLAVIVNVFKQQKQRPSEQTAQGPSPQPTQLTASGLGTSKPAVTIAETPAPSPMATVAEERARDYESAIACNKSGIKKTEMGDFAGALEDFDHAIGLDPKHSLAYLNRALIHYDNRDFRAAIDDFQRAIEISPNTEWFRLFVWLAEMHLGQRKRADPGLADYFGDRINAPGQDRHARIAAFFLD